MVDRYTELGRMHKQIHHLLLRVERLEKILVGLAEEDLHCAWDSNCTKPNVPHRSVECQPTPQVCTIRHPCGTPGFGSCNGLPRIDPKPCRNGGPGTPKMYCEVHRAWHMRPEPTIAQCSADEFTVEDKTIIRGQD